MQHAVIWCGVCCYLTWGVLLSDVGRAVIWCGARAAIWRGARAVIWCGACCYQLGGVPSQLWDVLHENAVMSSRGTTTLLPAIQSILTQRKCTERKRLFVKRYTPNMSLRCTIQKQTGGRRETERSSPHQEEEKCTLGVQRTHLLEYTPDQNMLATHKYHRLENVLKMWQGIEPRETTWKQEHIHTYLWKLSCSKKRTDVCSVVTFKAVFGLQ